MPHRSGIVLAFIRYMREGISERMKNLLNQWVREQGDLCSRIVLILPHCLEYDRYAIPKVHLHRDNLFRIAKAVQEMDQLLVSFG